MDKTSPRARAIRTFIVLLAGAAPAWATVNLATDFKTGATKIGLSLVAALLGGGLAYLLALTDFVANTPLGRATSTFLQGVVSGLGTFGFAALTFAEFERFGVLALTVVGSAFTSGILALAANYVEDQPVPVPPA